jgi:streptogramin lyase
MERLMRESWTFALIAALIVTSRLVASPTSSLASTDFVIQGTVTDSVGIPLRAALIKATANGKSLSVFSDARGHYAIIAAPAVYDVEAFFPGFHRKRTQLGRGANDPLNFALRRGVDIRDLTSADVQRLVPQVPDAEILRAGCTGCHSLDFVSHGAGWTAQQWREFLPTMTARLGYFYPFKKSEAAWAQYSAALEKHFGPKSKYFGDGTPIPAAMIVRPHVPDEVLKATYTAWQMPGAPQTMPHSVVTDSEGNSWISGNDTQTNAVMKFDPRTEAFTKFPIPTPAAVPHTPCIGKDGTVYMTLIRGGEVKMVSLDPKTNEMQEHRFAGTEAGPGNCRVDPDGNLWFRAEDLAGNILKYDVSTGQFSLHSIRMPPAYPPGSRILKAVAAGDPEPKVTGFYDVAIDSKGRVWEAPSTMGLLIRYDPKTTKTDWFNPPVSGYRGAFVDANDDLWVAAPWSHKVVRVNGKTGEYKLLATPTQYGEGYGMVVDKRRGYLWMADSGANTLTRITLKNREMIEFPLPTPGTHLRLGLGIDDKGRVWFPEFFHSALVVLDPHYGD